MLTPKLQQANGCVSEAAVKKKWRRLFKAEKHSTKRKDGVFLRVSDLGQRPIFQSIDDQGMELECKPPVKISLSARDVLSRPRSRETL